MTTFLPRAIASFLPLAMSVSWAQHPNIDASSGWLTTWAASPQAYTPPSADVTVPPEYRLPESIRNQTLRQIVHVSAGGKQLRIRLSNEFGVKPVTIGAAAIAISNGEDRITPGTSHPLTFDGRSSVVIAPGSPMLSDPVAIDVAPFGDLAISLYLPEDTRPETIHVEGLQTAYVSTSGNVVASTALPGAATFLQRLFLTSVEIRTEVGSRAVKGTIVTLGDSITDGEQSRPSANQRWPDLLARRLAAAGTPMSWGLANEGISGNALHTAPSTVDRLTPIPVHWPGSIGTSAHSAACAI
jgi:hypothetical protein